MNFDVPGCLAGHATDASAHTGCTVLVFPDGAACAAHVPGSATGTRELGALAPGHLARRVHALVLSGGSAFGLATADGVMATLAERGIGHRVGAYVVPIVPSAILFDLSVATRRPTATDGRAAAEAALLGAPFERGSVGAGAGALVGVSSGESAPGGLGWQTTPVGPWKLGVVVACNAVGSILSNSGRKAASAAILGLGNEGSSHGSAPETVVEASFSTVSGLHRASIRAADGTWLAGGEPLPGEVGEEGAHTTLVAVVTDATLDREQATVVAKMASAGLARAIEPAFLPFDGDVVFCAATGRVDTPVAPEALAGLGHAAALLVASAVREGVRLAQGR